MEYLRTNNLSPAMSFFRQSLSACPTDPLVYSEIGVLHYMNEEYDLAIDNFRSAIELIHPQVVDAWEATFFNIAHAFRKLESFDEARRYYEVFVLSPEDVFPNAYVEDGAEHIPWQRVDPLCPWYQLSLTRQVR
jgi:anaphase-promoting complex subunit 6